MAVRIYVATRPALDARPDHIQVHSTRLSWEAQDQPACLRTPLAVTGSLLPCGQDTRARDKRTQLGESGRRPIESSGVHT